MERREGSSLTGLAHRGSPRRCSPPPPPHTPPRTIKGIGEEQKNIENENTKRKQVKKKDATNLIYSPRSASSSLSVCSGLPTLIRMKPESSFLE